MIKISIQKTNSPKETICTFEFKQSVLKSIIEDTPLEMRTDIHCPYAQTYVDPTRCFYKKNCIFKKIRKG